MNLSSNNNENKKTKKKKKKQRSSSTVDEFDIALNSSPTNNQINKSYSDVDYFSMMPVALSQSINHDKTLRNRDSLSDCYLNPSESVQTTNNGNYVQTRVIKPRVFEISVIDYRKEQQVPNYNDVDHQ